MCSALYYITCSFASTVDSFEACQRSGPHSSCWVKQNDRYGVWRFRRVGHYWCRAGKTLTSNSGSVSPCCMCMYPPPHMVCACILLLIYSYIKLWFCLFLTLFRSLSQKSSTKGLIQQLHHGTDFGEFIVTIVITIVLI